MTIKQVLIISGLLFLQAIDLSSQNGISEEEKKEALFIEGTMLLVLSKHEEANTIFLKLLKEDKENATLNFQISRCYLELNKKTEGLEYARKAVRFDTQNTFFLEQLIDLLLDEGMLNEATAYAEQLYMLEPQNDLYFDHWISILAHQESYDALLTAIQGKIENFGASPDLLLKLAGTQLKMGKAKKAVNTLENALDQFPKEVEVHLQLIAFYADKNDLTNTQKGIEQFLSQFPEKEEALLNIPGVGRLMNKTNKEDNPLSSMMRSTQISLDQKIKAAIPYLTAFVNEQDLRAKQILKDVLPDLEEQYPNNPKVQAIKGDLYFYSNEFKEAITAYESCLNNKKNLLAVWEHLLYSYYHNSQINKLIERGEDALLYFPNQSAIWYYYCLGLVENNKIDDALYEIEGYSYLLEGNLQQTINAHILKARCLLAQGAFNDAIQELEKGSQAEKKAGITSGNPYLDIYKLIVLSEDPNKKAESLKLSKKLETLSELALYQFAKAKSLNQNDKLEEALISIDSALLGEHPVTGEFHELKGDILFKSNNLELAKQAYEIALKKNGNLNRINTKLNRLK